MKRLLFSILFCFEFLILKSQGFVVGPSENAYISIIDMVNSNVNCGDDFKNKIIHISPFNIPLSTISTIEAIAYKDGIPFSSNISIISYFNSSINQFLVPLGIFSNLPQGSYDIIIKCVTTSGATYYSSSILSPLSTFGYNYGFNNDFDNFINTVAISYVKDSQEFIQNECNVKVKVDIPIISTTNEKLNNICKIDSCDVLNLVNSFNFSNGFINYPTIFNGYTFNKLDSGYNCNSDIKWYEIKYSCISFCDSIVFLKIKISSDCNIFLCDNFICGTNAGTQLNPFLNNLKGSFRVNKSYVYNTKRVSLNSQNKRKGEYYLDYNPLFSSNNWVLSNDPNWIVENQTTLINIKGNILETRNPLGIFTSSKFGFNGTIQTAIATNSKYRNFISLGFDDEEYYEWNCGNKTHLILEKYFLPIITQNTPIRKNNSSQSFNISYANSSNLESHTGMYSYKVIPTCILNNSSSSYNFCDKFFLSKVIPLCGTDPNYENLTYNINSNINAESIENSYNLSFNVEKGKKYILSYWVKNLNPPLGSNPDASLGYIKVAFDCDTNYIRVNNPKIGLIEGWKQMTEVFEVANQNYLLKLVFIPNSYGSFYDDIRIFPFDANMKSFVYEPRTLKLTAELDENNYATFYDYDEEGELIRIRKETEKGIMSINEQRKALKISQ